MPSDVPAEWQGGRGSVPLESWLGVLGRVGKCWEIGWSVRECICQCIASSKLLESYLKQKQQSAQRLLELGQPPFRGMRGHRDQHTGWQP
jgi:hypothetical protein